MGNLPENTQRIIVSVSNGHSESNNEAAQSKQNKNPKQ